MQLLFEPELFEFETQAAEISRSSHEYIRWVQQSLNKVLGARLNVDGVGGPQTRSAIRIFQQRGGLKADGVAGAATERALVSAGAAQPPGGASQPTPVVPGRLIKREDQPPAYTLYIDV